MQVAGCASEDGDSATANQFKRCGVVTVRRAGKALGCGNNTPQVNGGRLLRQIDTIYVMQMHYSPWR